MISRKKTIQTNLSSDQLTLIIGPFFLGGFLLPSSIGIIKIRSEDPYLNQINISKGMSAKGFGSRCSLDSPKNVPTQRPDENPSGSDVSAF